MSFEAPFYQIEKLKSGDWDMRSIVELEISRRGGWVNAHAHLDRAYTINRENLHFAYRPLQDKWDLVDEIKRRSSVIDIYDRMAYALDFQRARGVTALGTFIDVDEVVEGKAIKAAQKLRTANPDFPLVFINQTLKGVLNPTARYWFDLGASFCDIIGGLPGKDRDREGEHLDIVLGTAKQMGKMAHVHVDQFNAPQEIETALLWQKTVEHGLQGRTVGIHGISIAAHQELYRRGLYRHLRDAGIAFITCPTAWIDSRRSEVLAPTHNSIAPVEEMVAEGIVVAIGTDNIADVYKPFTDGDMWTELRFLLESCHYYEIEQLAQIASVNGRQLLGLK